MTKFTKKLPVVKNIIQQILYWYFFQDQNQYDISPYNKPAIQGISWLPDKRAYKIQFKLKRKAGTVVVAENILNCIAFYQPQLEEVLLHSLVDGVLHRDRTTADE